MSGSNEKADFYQARVTEAMEKFFPLIMARRKSTDCPWVNNKVLKLIAWRRKVYRKQGRSGAWYRLR